MNTPLPVPSAFARTPARLLALLGAVAALTLHADPVGGEVDPINTLTSVDYIDDIDIVPSVGQTDTTVVTGTINNNSDTGWKLTIVSGNQGKLYRAGSSGGAGREIAYTSIKFTRTSGTLGTGLTNPDNTTKNIATGAGAGGTAGTTVFNTGTAFATPGTATSATVDYVFALKISWSANTSVLRGSYTDTLTLTLADDST